MMNDETRNYIKMVQQRNFPERAYAPQVVPTLLSPYDVGSITQDVKELLRHAPKETSRSFGENPGIIEVMGIIRDINIGQKDLEKKLRLDNSWSYRNSTKAVEYIKSVLGHPTAQRSVHDIFISQMQNVGDLNYVLALTAKNSVKDLTATKMARDRVWDRNEKEYETLQGYKKQLEPKIHELDELKERLGDMDRENPKYYVTVKQLINLEREVSDTQFRGRMVKIYDQHHKQDKQNLEHQEYLFDTVLKSVMEIALHTQLLGETLANNEPIWRNVGPLAYMAGEAYKGVIVLGDSVKVLNDTYMDGVRRISYALKHHKGMQLVEGTNSDIKKLVAEIDSGRMNLELPR